MNDLDTLAYAQVEQERAHGHFAPGLRSKAFADAGGDLQRAEAIYIKYRAEQIKQEYLREIARRKEEERERQKAAQREEERKTALRRQEKAKRAAGKLKRMAKIAIMTFFIYITFGMIFTTLYTLFH